MKILKNIKYGEIGENFRMLVLFAAISLPFILIPFSIVSGALEADGKTSEYADTYSSKQPVSVSEIKTAHPMSATARAKQSAMSHLPAKTLIGYDASVLAALKKMNLVVDHLDAWMDQHQGTALKHVKFMPRDMQKSVAGTALFIRKSNSKIDEKTAWREAAALVHYSAKYGVPSALTTAVAHAESTFNPDAISPKGAAGVMQVMWDIHNNLLQSNGIMATPGANPLADPELAIAAGCLLLSRYIRAYGSVQSAMDRYYGAKSTTYRNKITRNMARILDHHAALPF